MSDNVVALDPGTANLVVAYYVQQDGNKVVRTAKMRNAFFEIPNTAESRRMLEIQKVPQFELEDRLYIAGNEAYEMAHIFGKELRRPMQSGVISSGEADAIPMITRMVGRLLKEARVQKGWKCAYSCPADPVDVDTDNVFHRSIIEGILKKNELEPKMVTEGHAVVLSELGGEKFTGIGISLGGGMCNVAVCYRSVPVIVFSSSRCGDWIDEKAAQACGEVRPRMTAAKEDPSFSLIDESPSREHAALVSYYQAVIEYTMTQIANRFNTGKDMPRFQEPVSIALAGGTASPRGFVELFKRVYDRMEFPIPVRDIWVVEDPLFSVVKGCLIAGSI